MKTLCVAVVVLGLTSVCQSALNQSLDLSGRWYLIALSSSYCLLPVFLNYFLQPSVFVDITPQATPNVYTANYTIHLYEYCSSVVKPFPLVNCSHCGSDSNNSLSHGPNTLLYTGCPDCLVLKAKKDTDVSLLFSRRKTVTDDELKEFEALSDCLGWSKPEVLNTNHGYLNSKSLDVADMEEVSVLSHKLVQRFQSTHMAPVPSHCIDRDPSNHPPAGLEWVQEAFNHVLKLQQH